MSSEAITHQETMWGFRANDVKLANLPREGFAALGKGSSDTSHRFTGLQFQLASSRGMV